MKLSSINLNLLVALDALLEEQSVTKAAKRLNLSQAQLSSILKELRNIFDDELLIRGPGRQMVITEKANSLIIPVNEAINKFEEIFNSGKTFSPHKTKAHFTIGSMNDYISTSLCPELFRIIYEKAQGISINTVHTTEINDYNSFVGQKLDLAIGHFQLSSRSICKEEVCKTKFLCGISKNHKAIRNGKISINEFKNYPLIFVFYDEHYWRPIIEKLDENLGKGNYRYSALPHATAIMRLIEETDYICIANINTAKTLSEKFDLLTMELPFQTPMITYYMYWKKVNTSSQAHSWLRKNIKKIFSIKLNELQCFNKN